MARLHVSIPLRWSDLDAYEHVNNARLFTLLEEARIAAFWSGAAHQAPTAVLATGPGSPSITLVAGQRVEYREQIPFHREPLDVELWIGRLGGASLHLYYEVYSPVGHEPRRLYVRAATSIVLVDRATGAPRRVTEEERAAWEPYLEAPLEFRRL